MQMSSDRILVNIQTEKNTKTHISLQEKGCLDIITRKMLFRD